MKTMISFWMVFMAAILSPLSSLAAESSTTTSQVAQSESQAMPDNFSSEVGTVNCTGEGEHAICIET